MLTQQEVLSLPMPSNDAKASTVRDYLKALLNVLWREEEGFSGKRPFGNSGWQDEVYVALVRGGVIDGRIDEDGNLDVDYRIAEKVVLLAIAAL